MLIELNLGEGFKGFVMSGLLFWCFVYCFSLKNCTLYKMYYILFDNNIIINCIKT